jgi:hypothetical protein
MRTTRPTDDDLRVIVQTLAVSGSLGQDDGSALLREIDYLRQEIGDLRADLEDAEARAEVAERVRDESQAAFEKAMMAQFDAEARAERYRAALASLLESHDNLYVAHFGAMMPPGFETDPTVDIAAKPARQLLAASDGPAAEPERDRLRAALEWYADQKHYDDACIPGRLVGGGWAGAEPQEADWDPDCGETARKALGLPEPWASDAPPAEAGEGADA